ncbi:hypothetical protein Ancab_003099 [Ancistrocladus abbreviatus]
MEFRVEQIAMEWLKGSFVARVLDVEAIPHLQHKLRQEGLLHYRVWHIEGAIILLSSLNAGLLKAYVTEGANHLSKWLADIRLWSYKELASFWGTLVWVGECTKWKRNFEMAQVLILIALAGWINEVVRVKVNNHFFLVTVMEEEGGICVWSGNDVQCVEHVEEGASGAIIREWSKTVSRVLTFRPARPPEILKFSLTRIRTLLKHEGERSDAGCLVKKGKSAFGVSVEEGIRAIHYKSGPLKHDWADLSRWAQRWRWFRRPKLSSLRKNKKRSRGPKESKPIGLALKCLLRKPKGKGHWKWWRIMKNNKSKQDEMVAITSCEDDDKETSAPAFTKMVSCDVGEEGPSASAITVALRRAFSPSISNSGAFSGEHSLLLTCIKDMKLKDRWARASSVTPAALNTAALVHSNILFTLTSSFAVNAQDPSPHELLANDFYPDMDVVVIVISGLNSQERAFLDLRNEDDHRFLCIWALQEDSLDSPKASETLKNVVTGIMPVMVGRRQGEKACPPDLSPNFQNIEAELSKLKTWEIMTTSIMGPPGAETIEVGLTCLAELYVCMEDLIPFPATHLALLHHDGGKLVEEAVDGSIPLLDTCSIARDLIVLLKEQVQDVRSALRRRGGYLDADPYLATVVRVLREVSASTINSFRHLLSFLTMAVLRSEASGWSMISKLMSGGSLASNRDLLNEVGAVDTALYSFHRNGQSNDAKTNVQLVQERLRKLEASIQSLEVGLNQLFRHLVQNRVSLLNIITH